MEIQVDKKEISSVEYELKVTVPAETMSERVSEAMQTVAKNVRMPGFRPGKVPRKVLEQKFGRAVVEDTVQEVLQQAYRDALAESKLEPVVPAEMSQVDFEEGSPLTFTALVEIMPSFEIPELSEVTVELVQPSASEDDIAEALENIRESQAILEPVDEPAGEDSVVVVDFQELDSSGVPIVGRSQKDITVDMRKQSFGEEFAAKVKGLQSGQNTVVVFKSEGAQGQQAKETKIQVTVQNVQRKDLPPVDDDFAKAVNPNLNSLDDLKNDLKKYIEARSGHQAREQMFRSLADSLLKKTDFPIPPKMLDRYLTRLAEDGVKGQNGKADEKDLEAFKEKYRTSAVWNLRWHILRQKIITEQGIDVNKAEFAREFERLAAIEQTTPEQLKGKLTEEQKDRIRDDLIERKVLAYLERSVQVVPREITVAEFEGRTPGKIITSS